MDTTTTETQDRADMARLAQGQDTALNDLMARHAQPLFQFLYRMLGNEDDANDMAQETFLRVYQHRNEFKSGAKFTSWLYTIAGNLARNHYRWRSRHPNVSLECENDATGQSLSQMLPSPDPSPNQKSLDAERHAAVRSAVAQLPEEMKEAIILCEWQELPVAEAAQILKSTPKAIESRLYRARKLLREALKQWFC